MAEERGEQIEMDPTQQNYELAIPTPVEGTSRGDQINAAVIIASQVANISLDNAAADAYDGAPSSESAALEYFGQKTDAVTMDFVLVPVPDNKKPPPHGEFGWTQKEGETWVFFEMGDTTKFKFPCAAPTNNCGFTNEGYQKEEGTNTPYYSAVTRSRPSLSVSVGVGAEDRHYDDVCPDDLPPPPEPFDTGDRRSLPLPIGPFDIDNRGPARVIPRKRGGYCVSGQYHDPDPTDEPPLIVKEFTSWLGQGGFVLIHGGVALSLWLFCALFVMRDPENGLPLAIQTGPTLFLIGLIPMPALRSYPESMELAAIQYGMWAIIYATCGTVILKVAIYCLMIAFLVARAHDLVGTIEGSYSWSQPAVWNTAIVSAQTLFGLVIFEAIPDPGSDKLTISSAIFVILLVHACILVFATAYLKEISERAPKVCRGWPSVVRTVTVLVTLFNLVGPVVAIFTRGRFYDLFNDV